MLEGAKVETPFLKFIEAAPHLENDGIVVILVGGNSLTHFGKRLVDHVEPVVEKLFNWIFQVQEASTKSLRKP